MLKGKGMSTLQIKKELGSKLNISIIVNLMCDQGLLMRGRSDKGWKSNTHTYYLFSDYFPGMDLNAVDPAQARETTVRQYLAAYGPATVKDISWWSGFTMTEVRRILQTLARETAEVEIPELKGSYVMLADGRSRPGSAFDPPSQPVVNLLPALDPYLMGYKERERYLDNQHYNLVFDRSGNSTSTILVEGRVAGVWDFSDKPRPTVKLFLFHELEKKVLSRGGVARPRHRPVHRRQGRGGRDVRSDGAADTEERRRIHVTAGAFDREENHSMTLQYAHGQSSDAIHPCHPSGRAEG